MNVQNPVKYSTLAQGWDEIAATISSRASESQVLEARKIFYSGVLHLWALLQEIMAEVDTPQDARISSIHAELKRFVAEMPLINGAQL